MASENRLQTGGWWVERYLITFTFRQGCLHGNRYADPWVRCYNMTIFRIAYLKRIKIAIILVEDLSKHISIVRLTWGYQDHSYWCIKLRYDIYWILQRCQNLCHVPYQPKPSISHQGQSSLEADKKSNVKPLFLFYFLKYIENR